MKITAVDLTPVSIPFREPETWLWGRREGISNVIVQVHTDEGIVGLGEAVGFPSVPQVLEALTQIVSVLVSQDPYRIEYLTRRLYTRRGWHHYRQAAGPAARLRVDPNEAWTPAEAIRIIEKLAAFDLEFVEQPVSMYDLDAMARVRAAVSVPIAANQGAWLEFNVLDIVRRQAADIILTD